MICFMSCYIANMYMYMHGCSPEPKEAFQPSVSKSHARKFTQNPYTTIFQAIKRHVRIFAHFRVAGIYQSIYVYLHLPIYHVPGILGTKKGGNVMTLGPLYALCQFVSQRSKESAGSPFHVGIKNLTNGDY